MARVSLMTGGLQRAVDSGTRFGLRRLAGEQPRIKYSEIWRDDREEEKEDSDDLGDVEHVPGLQEVSETGQCDDGQADDGTREALCPRFVVVRKHVRHLSPV
jgi:hypothetical protein